MNWNLRPLDAQTLPYPSGSEEEGASQQQTITAFLAPVSEALSASRREVFDLAAHRIMELVNMPGLLKGEDFLQVRRRRRRRVGVGGSRVSRARGGIMWAEVVSDKPGSSAKQGLLLICDEYMCMHTFSNHSDCCLACMPLLPGRGVGPEVPRSRRSLPRRGGC